MYAKLAALSVFADYWSLIAHGVSAKPLAEWIGIKKGAKYHSAHKKYSNTILTEPKA